MENHINLLPKNWESGLEMAMLIAQDHSKSSRARAYICSPLRAKDSEGVYNNMRAARAYLCYANTYLGTHAWAPHAFVPPILCDNSPSERALAIRFGLELLELSNEMHVCGSRLSSGMQNEICRAAQLGIPIHVYEASLFDMIRNILDDMDENVTLVKYCPGHPLMAQNANELFRNEVTTICVNSINSSTSVHVRR